MTNEIKKTLAEHFKVERSNAEALERKRLNLEEDDALPAYEHAEYPKYKYHATEAPLLCAHPDHETALGEQWSDEPVPAQAVALVATRKNR